MRALRRAGGLADLFDERWRTSAAKFACDTNVLVDVLRTPAAEGVCAAGRAAGRFVP